MQIFVKTVRLWSLKGGLGAGTPGRCASWPGSPCGIRARRSDSKEASGRERRERHVMPVEYMLGGPVVLLCEATSSCSVLQLQRGCLARQH
jgi:hypothetical protein